MKWSRRLGKSGHQSCCVLNLIRTPIYQFVRVSNISIQVLYFHQNHSPSQYQIYFEAHIVSFKAITVNGSVTSGPEKQMSVGIKMSPLLDFQNRWRRREAELQFLKSSRLSLQTKLYFLGRHFGEPSWSKVLVLLLSS